MCVTRKRTTHNCSSHAYLCGFQRIVFHVKRKRLLFGTERFLTTACVGWITGNPFLPGKLMFFLAIANGLDVTHLSVQPGKQLESEAHH
jgi:hypothetical protein